MLTQLVDPACWLGLLTQFVLSNLCWPVLMLTDSTVRLPWLDGGCSDVLVSFGSSKCFSRCDRTKPAATELQGNRTLVQFNIRVQPEVQPWVETVMNPKSISARQSQQGGEIIGYTHSHALLFTAMSLTEIWSWQKKVLTRCWQSVNESVDGLSTTSAWTILTARN